MNLTLRTLLFCTFALASLSAHSGSRGYDILWINLVDGEDHVATKAIREYGKTPPKDKNCLLIYDDLGGNLYSRIRPPGVTNALIKKALNGNRKSESKLKSIIKKFEDDRVSGFDGVLVYDEVNGRRFLTAISAGKGKPKSTSEILENPLTKNVLRKMICGVITPIEDNFSP